MKDYTEEAKAAVENTDYILFEEYPVPLLVEISEKLSTLITLIEERRKLPLF
jgi:diphthamide biosynthesis methyltransferase